MSDINVSINKSKVNKNQVINGTFLSDTITGGQKNDTIYSNGGSDNIDGKNGSDTVFVKNTDLSDNLITVNDSGTGANDNDTVIFQNNTQGASYIIGNMSVLFDVTRDGSVTDENYGYTRGDKLLFTTSGEETDLTKGLTSSGVEEYKVIGVDKTYVLSETNIDTIAQNVANWLANNNYDSSADVFENENTEGDLEALIAIYNSSTNNAWIEQA